MADAEAIENDLDNAPQQQEVFLGRRRPLGLDLTDRNQVEIEQATPDYVFTNAGYNGDQTRRWQALFRHPMVGSHLLRAISRNNWIVMSDILVPHLVQGNVSAANMEVIRNSVSWPMFLTHLRALNANPETAIPSLEHIAGQFTEFGGNSIAGIREGRVHYDQGLAGYKSIARQGYRDVQPPGGYGAVPVDNRVESGQAFQMVRNMYKDIPRTTAALKPEAQFSDLLNRVNDEVDSGLYRYKEDLLNYKSNLVYTALNTLKKQLNDRKLRMGGDTFVFNNAVSTYYPTNGANAFFPVVIKLRVVGTGTILSSPAAGVYVVNSRNPVEVSQVMKLVNFGTARRKEYNFALAPYFGYVDSMYGILKNPVLIPEEKATNFRMTQQQTAFSQGLTIGTHHRLTINVGKSNALGVGGGDGTDYLVGMTTAFRAIVTQLASIRDAVARIHGVNVAQPDAQPNLRTITIRMTHVIQGILGVYWNTGIEDGRLTVVYADNTAHPLLRNANVVAFGVSMDVNGTILVPRITGVRLNERQIAANQARLLGRVQVDAWYTENIGPLLAMVREKITPEVNAFWGERQALRIRFNQIAQQNDFQWRIPEVPDARIVAFIDGILALSGFDSEPALLATYMGAQQVEFNRIFRDNLSILDFWANHLVDFDRPLRVPSNADPSATEVIDSKEHLLTYLANRLEAQANSIQADYLRAAGAGVGPVRRVGANANAMIIPWGASAIHMPVPANSELRVKVWLEGFDNPLAYIKYIQLMSWIRNFTYSRQQEKQKIARGRISKFVSADTRSLRKVVATFGGVPDTVIAKRT